MIVTEGFTWLHGSCGASRSGPWFNIKMSSYQYRKSHCGEKTVVKSSYLHNGVSLTGKIASLYWISPQKRLLKILVHLYGFYLTNPGSRLVSTHESFPTAVPPSLPVSTSKPHPRVQGSHNEVGDKAKWHKHPGCLTLSKINVRADRAH